jgi:DNA-binding Lrp family transcriptional regulator
VIGTEIDELDRRLLHAVQIEPRAAWAALAPVLGADPSTLARRWRRLSSEGIAWTTGFVTRVQPALVEIVCAPDTVDAVIEKMLEDRRVISLDYTSGSRDLLAVITTDDLPGLAEYGRKTLGRIPGVRSMRTHLINEVFSDGSNWRLGALSPDEVARIPPATRPRTRAPRHVASDLQEAIEREVWIDGRVPVAAIAEKYGFTPQRVADAIAVLRDNGELGFRTDIARSLSGWPVSTWYFIEAPARTIELVRTALSRVPEIRLAFTASSRFNLILFVWLKTLAEVNRFEIALENALAGARIADRSVVLQLVKHLGRTVGSDTRVIGQAG